MFIRLVRATVPVVTATWASADRSNAPGYLARTGTTPLTPDELQALIAALAEASRERDG